MLISPPFLLPKQGNDSEDAWLDRCMDGGHPGDGAFPLSFNLSWHGGIHLRAPISNGQSEPIRAIADGTVVFVRQPTARVDDRSHPLNYRGWTDNGCVVIRHDNEIGEGASASVTFFSIIMHLSQIDATVKVGRSIWRKSAIGIAGQIDGSLERKIHFEIVCDDANMEKLVGRSAGDLSTSRDGRLDAIFGNIYFTLPPGTKFYAQKPLDHLSLAHIQPQKKKPKDPLPPIQAIHPAYTCAADEKLFVSLRYSGGEGASGHRGSAYLETLRSDGSSLGDRLEEVDAEYNLYARAKEICRAYASNARPAISAIYEMLRFGRIVNDAQITLSPSDAPHWRKVRHPNGEGWVNLNAPGVRKFSDSDFPQWQHWHIIDDSKDKDSRCDSAVLRGWLDISGDGKVDPIEATSRLVDSSTRHRLSHTVCKFPTEWEAATIDQRWGWLKSRTEENPIPFNDADFDRIRSHIQALAFFPANTGLPSSHWHFHPREFLRHFRRCDWLSEREVLRCMPLVYLANKGNKTTPIVQNTLNTPTARTRLNERGRISILRTTQKYGITGKRLCHFFSQVYQETGVLRWAQELASGAEYEGRTDLGNTHKGDGKRFKGRGLIQTTGRTNYESYSTYHGKTGPNSFTTEPNNLLLATNTYYAVDAAGLYWVSRNIGNRQINICRIADQGVEEEHIRKATKNVNGAEDGLWTGLIARRSHTKLTSFILLDELNPPSTEKARTDV